MSHSQRIGTPGYTQLVLSSLYLRLSNHSAAQPERPSCDATELRLPSHDLGIGNDIEDASEFTPIHQTCRPVTGFTISLAPKIWPLTNASGRGASSVVCSLKCPVGINDSLAVSVSPTWASANAASSG